MFHAGVNEANIEERMIFCNAKHNIIARISSIADFTILSLFLREQICQIWVVYP